jgi:plastocyanin domain-containing protein
MIRAALLALVVVGCKKEPEPPKPAAAAPAQVTKDGVRRIEVEAGQDGYVPARIPGKPGEKLMLVFTRTIDADCLAQLKTPDGKLVDLPKGTPVDVPVMVPATGEVGFACGMDMFHGAVVAAAP